MPSEDTLSAEIGINSKIKHNLHGFLWLLLEKKNLFSFTSSHWLRSVTVAISDFVQCNEFNANLALVTNIAKLVQLYTDFISTSM